MADNDAAGSSTGLDAGDHVATDAKIDVARDGTPSSMESTPEADGGNEVQEPAAQPQKRKGGRKPVSFQDLSLSRGSNRLWTDLRDDGSSLFNRFVSRETCRSTKI
jgi:hypothetical protein